MVLDNFSFSLDKFAAFITKNPAPRWGVSYHIFVISDTEIRNALESHLYLHQYLFCRSRIS